MRKLLNAIEEITMCVLCTVLGFILAVLMFVSANPDKDCCIHCQARQIQEHVSDKTEDILDTAEDIFDEYFK